MDRKIILALLLLLSAQLMAQRVEYRRTFTAMGSAFEVVIVAGADSAVWANAHLTDAEAHIGIIEQLISSWIPESQTSQINENAGIRMVQVSPDLFDLIERCIALSNLTRGAFDITYASMANIWQFDEANRYTWPDSAMIEEKRQLINYQAIYTNGADVMVYLDKPGMRIGFGGVGKGFAADQTAKYLQLQGVKNGVINASGDLYCWGNDASGNAWRVAVVDPKNKQRVRLWLEATNQAVVTSGDYEKYKIHNGVRYAHIINPKTGYPVTGIFSATVIAPSAELADALATAIFVLGVQAGLDLINQLPDTECVIIDSENQLWTSENISVATDD